MSTTATHLFISGRVQGVSYRASTRAEAERRGVQGWVRNLDDGRVEAWLEGPEAAVEALTSWCHDGPTYARVEAVEREDVAPEGFDAFTIRR